MRKLAGVATMLCASFPAIAATCGIAIDNAQQASQRADWVFEGDVDSFMAIKTGEPSEIILGKIKPLREKASLEGRTMALPISPCYASGLATWIRENGGTLEGKRIRAYGNTHSESPKRRLFYLELATQAAPVWNPPAYADKVHAADVHAPVSGGWHRANSTEGNFAVDMPGPYIDATTTKDGANSFLLRATDKHGATFIAVLQQSSYEISPMQGSFDQEYQKTSKTSRLLVNGYPAFDFVSKEDGPLAKYSRWIRIPGATIMLGAYIPKNGNPESLQYVKRFYDSLLIR